MNLDYYFPYVAANERKGIPANWMSEVTTVQNTSFANLVYPVSSIQSESGIPVTTYNPNYAVIIGACITFVLSLLCCVYALMKDCTTQSDLEAELQARLHYGSIHVQQ